MSKRPTKDSLGKELPASGAADVSGAALTDLAARVLAAGDAPHLAPIRHVLKVQPVLLYSVPKRKEGVSWRSWGAIQTEEQAAEEKRRIEGELKRLGERADYPLEMRPVATVKTVEEATALAQGDHDTVIAYAAGSPLPVLQALLDPTKHNLMFLRHRSGPVYLWYEIAHPRYLRNGSDEFVQPGMGVEDIVVDDYDEVLWRLRAFGGLKNILGKRILTVGGASGWGMGRTIAPDRARELWKLEMVDLPYPDLGKLIEAAMSDAALMERCRQEADAYLRQPGLTLRTDRSFVVQAFVLTEVFRRAMDAAQTDAITINECMGTIMQVSKTTACLPLSLLNDEGRLAFCESDFVVIPSGILLHYISGKPVFLNDPTHPHENLVTQAHCTAPRKMDGVNLEETILLTHYESDWGVAPKVNMRKGQTVTNLIPDFASRRWVGFEGTIADHPFLDICRSQIDVEIKGDTELLLREMRGFHWMTCYGNYLREVGYILRKVGVDWLNVSG